jgi:hypothetical protein
LDFSPVSYWLSAFFPNLCTVVSKKTKLSCLASFCPLFLKTKQHLGFPGVVYFFNKDHIEMLQICMRKRGREGGPRSLNLSQQVDVAFASLVKIGNTTKFKIEHLLNSKQKKTKQ